MTKEKRCLKVTAYFYLPTKDADRKELRYYSATTPGSFILYDEFNNRLTEKAIPFTNWGQLQNKVEKERHKRVYKLIKVKV